MTQIITHQLTKAAATALFEEHAVLHGAVDAIDVHTVCELFGEPAARFIERVTCYGSSFAGGKDYNGYGSCEDGDPCLSFFYLSGFYKIVSDHNHRLQVIAHQNSEGGKIFDTVWGERVARLRAQDEEDERKREERKAKRAAARVAKAAKEATAKSS